MKLTTTTLRTLSLASCLAIGQWAQAQIHDTRSRMIATVFGNAHVRHNEATATRPSGARAAFELQRAYIGYQHALNSAWAGRVLFDVTSDSTLKGSHYNVYVKNAYICYHKPMWQVFLGMIPTDLYTDAEHHWEKRYLAMNVNELSGFGSSADLGVGFYYKPAEQWSLHVQLLNGEGYRHVQADSSFKASLSVGYRPTKALALHLYGDVMTLPNSTQLTTNAFVGYTHPKFRLGFEGGLQFNQRGRKGYNMAIASLWATYRCSKKLHLFARGDVQEPTVDGRSDAVSNAWRDGKTRYRAIVGADITALHLHGTQQVRFSPNVQWTQTYAGHNQVTAYLSLGAFF